MVFKKGHPSRKGMGRTKGSFKKGSTPWNKGLTKEKDKRLNFERPTAFKKGVHPKTQFKKGLKHTEEWKKNHSKKMKGENHPNWQGGITPLNKLLRNSAMYQIWRNAVFLRDNFTCQNPNCEFCNNKMGVLLNAHHIKSFADYPELVFRVDNGIAYCAEFHLKPKLHKIRGRLK